MSYDQTVWALPFADKSTTIVTGGVAQNIVPVNHARGYLFLLNPVSATEAVWFSLVGSAVINGESTGSVRLDAGQSVTWDGVVMPTNALSIIASTTGHKVTCTEAGAV